MSSTKKTVLITGCSDGGIGGALAEAFHQKGYHVFATARTTSKISPSLASSSDVTVLKLDVLSTESIAAAVDSVAKVTGGKLDVLVNNSGGGGEFLPGLDSSIEQGRELFDLNFWAVLSVIKAFIPLLIKAKGCIVNNTSVAGAMGIPFQSLYNASKAAEIVASETWRLEFAPLNVRIITLMTGAVKSKFFDSVTPPTLPENSYYSNIRQPIQDLSDGRLQANGMGTKEYASKVVAAVARGSTGKVWIGGDAPLAAFGVRFFPQFVLDHILGGMYPFLRKLQ